MHYKLLAFLAILFYQCILQNKIHVSLWDETFKSAIRMSQSSYQLPWQETYSIS